MIAFIQPLPVGNAVRGILALPSGSERTRVLRKLADTFTGPDDPQAGVVYEGVEPAFLDVEALTNGTPYYYRAYHLVGGNWVATATQSATPARTLGYDGPNPLELIRKRVELSLKQEVLAGALAHELSYIPVYTAPPLYEETRWPVVTVHLRNDGPQQRAVGEIIGPDIYDEDDDTWTSGEGWLSMVRLDVMGWSLNSDERNDLRLAIKRALMGNLPVFRAAGIDQFTFDQSDLDDTESYQAPVYQTIANVSGVMPSVVTAVTSAIEDVTVEAEAV